VLHLKLNLTTEQGFTIYADKLSIKAEDGWMIEKILVPDSTQQHDPISGKDVKVYKGGSFELLLYKLFVSQLPSSAKIRIQYLGCTQSICLFPHSETVVFAFDRLTKALHKDTFDLFKNLGTPPRDTLDELRLDSKTPHSANQEQVAKSWEESLLSGLNLPEVSLLVLLLISFVGGLLTNLTPCVYPMIPLTVRVLSRQAHSPLWGSSLYALGIMVSYTILGSLTAYTGILFGSISGSPWFNIVLAAVMFLLGATLLGVGNLGNLSFFQNLGDKLSRGGTGKRSAFFMGLGAGLVAAPCTGPILGALLAYSLSANNLAQSIAIMLCYSFGFSLPYVFLGILSVKTQALKISLNFSNSLKVIFAAALFGLGFYYLRIPLYPWFQAISSHFWAIFTGIMLLLAIVAFKKPLFAALFLGAGIFTGIQFLTLKSVALSRTELHWVKSEAEAFIKFQETNTGGILLDMWAEWCEACKKMEATTFADSRVISELQDQHWILAKIDLTVSNQKNDAIQNKYTVTGLPTIVVIPNPAYPEQFFLLTGFVSSQALLEGLQKR
jgi:thiol:disulfide interchange protein DsbD